MITVTWQKCACADCVCIIKIQEAVRKDDRHYCSDVCADGHLTGSGCEHAGCVCHG